MSFASDNLEETFRKYTMEKIMCIYERKFGLKASKPKLSSYHSIFPSKNNSYQQTKIASALWQSQFKKVGISNLGTQKKVAVARKHNTKFTYTTNSYKLIGLYFWIIEINNQKEHIPVL